MVYSYFPSFSNDLKINSFSLFLFSGGLAIAGSSTDFVNKVLENVKNGQPSGGLEELRNT